MARSRGTTTRTRGRRRKALWITGGAIVTTIAVVSTVFTVLSINNAGRFEQAIDEHCAPLVVLAFRGSGEANLTAGVTSNAGAPYRYGESELVTNGWEGVTLHGLFDELSQTEFEGLRGETVPVVSIGPASEDEPFGYDAIPAVLEVSSVDSALSYSSSRLLHSASRGAEAATHLIREYLLASEGCPILPSFVAVGFSQGAMAARHTAELNPESVSAVLNIGDPYQKPHAPGVRSGGAGGTGIIRWKADDAQAAALDAFYEARTLRTAICHAGDPICEFSPIEGLAKLAVGAYGEHLDYYSDARDGEAREDALEIARLAHERHQLALAALDEGRSVSWDDASGAADTGLRTVSLSFAGTPTLFSAFTPSHLGSEVLYEFDLDGDGIFETTSPDGTIWVTFDDDEPRTIDVRVTDTTTGTSSTGRTRVTPAPGGSGDIVFTPDGDLVPETPPTSPEPPVADPPPPPAPPQPPAPPAPPAPPTPTPTPPPAPPASPTFSVDPDPVTAGTWAELRGTDLPPDVWVRANAPQLGIGDQQRSEVDGTFMMTVLFAAYISPGTYTIDIEYEATPGVWTQTTADVVVLAAPSASFVLAPDPAEPGETVTLQGTGLPPDVSVQVTSSELEINHPLTTLADGTFVLGFQVPLDLAPGVYTIDIEYEAQPGVWTQASVDAEVVAAPVSAPTVALTPQVMPGDSLQLVGSGFAADIEVSYLVFGVTTYDFADASGAFAQDFQVPQGTSPGRYDLTLGVHESPGVWRTYTYQFDVVELFWI